MSGDAPPENRPPPIETLDQQLATRQSDAAQSTDTYHRSVHDAAARYTIAKIVVCTYAAVVVAYFVVLLTDALRNGRNDVFYANASEFIKIAVIPIVTYVLGYYSARSSR